jgi:PAS domain S-box-containing protein
MMKKPHITPSNKEIKMNESDFIVSKTDTKGKITYCNEIFMSMAGYRESELIDQNHNIIRHPDMPQVAFKLAWDLISSGKEFFGFVKNLKKDGGYYWVFANITPDYNTNGKIIGYTSVRRRPPQSAIDAVTPIYKEMVKLEQSGGMEASGKYLFDFLDENKVTYDELIISLQGAK